MTQPGSRCFMSGPQLGACVACALDSVSECRGILAPHAGRRRPRKGGAKSRGQSIEYECIVRARTRTRVWATERRHSFIGMMWIVASYRTANQCAVGPFPIGRADPLEADALAGDVDLLHPDRVDVERLTVFVPNRVEANIPSVTDPEKKQRSVMIILSRLPTLGCRSLRYGKDPPSGWPIVRLVNSPDLEDLVSKSRAGAAGTPSG